MSQSMTITKRIFDPAFNMLSGLLIRVLNPFKKGDLIEINGQLGSVEHKGYTSTTLKNIEGERFEVANTIFYTHELHNLSNQSIINVDMLVSVELASDMILVKEMMLNYLKNRSSLLKHPSPKVSVKRIKDQYIELSIKVWCPLEKYLEVDSQMEVLLKEYLKVNRINLEPEKVEQNGLMIA